MSITLKVGVDLVEQFAGDLSRTTGNIQSAVARGVNVVAAAVRTESVAKVVSRVNFKPSYVDPKVTVGQEATPELPRAVIEAPIRGTLITNFGAQQQSMANVWTPAMYAAKFGSLNTNTRPNAKAPRMPWTPRTGDPLRAIAPGAKQAGISATIHAGNGASRFAHVFFIPAAQKGQDGSKWVTMTRPKGGGKAHAKYGPSVDQVVKGVWTDDEAEISTRLGDTVLAEVSDEITKGLL